MVLSGEVSSHRLVSKSEIQLLRLTTAYSFNWKQQNFIISSAIAKEFSQKNFIKSYYAIYQ